MSHKPEVTLSNLTQRFAARQRPQDFQTKGGDIFTDRKRQDIAAWTAFG
jgi:hypothetical protein